MDRKIRWIQGLVWMPLGLFKGVINLVQRLTTAVPNLFGTRDQFRGRQFFHGLGSGEWFRDDPSTLYLLCALFLSCSNLRTFHFDFRVRVHTPVRV